MRPPAPVPPHSSPYPLGYGLNPTPWRVVNLAAREAVCVTHPEAGLLRRYEGLTKEKKPRKYVLYSCRARDPHAGEVGYEPAPGSCWNKRGFCKTSGYSNEIFNTEAP